MQKFCFSILLGLLLTQASLAQQIRTEVLVYGSGTGSVAAGVQAARSGVKTLLITKNTWASTTKNLGNTPALQAGIWAEFAKNYTIKYKENQIFPDSAESVLKSMCDTVKRLSRQDYAEIKSIKKSGKAYEVLLANGRKIKTQVLIDATADQHLLKLLNLKLGKDTAASPILFRTSVAALDLQKTLPLSSLIPENSENIIAFNAPDSAIPAMHIGQAAGAAAAYCAFFKTSTKNLNVRIIQSELLTYKAVLIPFGDVLPNDSNFVKIQHVALSGLMNAGIQAKNGLRYWMPENTISTDELKLPMKSFYSRSQIWFEDHSSTKLTIEQTIDLLMYTATRGEELRREIERGWKTGFGFKTAYQPERPISRLEFAILAETYLQPFSIRVDLQGELLN